MAWRGVAGQSARATVCRSVCSMCTYALLAHVGFRAESMDMIIEESATIQSKAPLVYACMCMHASCVHACMHARMYVCMHVRTSTT